MFINKTDCCGCAACAHICPKKCIKMKADDEGFLYPDIDMAQCIDCGLCQKTCPVLKAKVEAQNDKPLNVYAAYNKDEDIRKKSSSGGMFIPLAKYVLDRDGIVFGVKFSDDMRYVYHNSAETLQDALMFCGSKYFQSDVKDTYQEVKTHLAEGRLVLYTGTPCQIEGLLAFLNKKYDNLICMDFICHGVPSAKVWQKYVEYTEKNNMKLALMSFREKGDSWGKKYCKITYSDGREVIEPLNQNTYGSAFSSDVCLRNSCYKCNFRKAMHISDITVGDFWGIDEAAPEMNDNKGISVVMLNSEKGKLVFDKIKDGLKLKEVSFEAAEKRNTIIRQPKYHKYRTRFYSGLDSDDFGKLVKKNAERNKPYSFVKKCVKKILGENGFDKLKKLIKH